MTSREPLHVTGEQEYPVPPFVHAEGVGFFLARARAVKPGFEPDDAVSEICRRLDDLPLALELAAVRVKALSSTQILERLDERLPLLTGGARDLPERQRTLRGAIEWSYDLLEKGEQRLFARLSVFRGGCTLDAAEAICDADLDTLQSLVDKSLLRHTDERYWMLETIREYAAERLEDWGEADELRRRHADWFVDLAEEAELHLLRSDAAWVERIEQEHDDLRAAYDFLEAAGETQLVLQLTGALLRFWTTRGHLAEGRRRAESALAADGRPTQSRARALHAAGELAGHLGDADAERRRLEEALALFVELGDDRRAAITRYGLATMWAHDRDWEKLRDDCERSLAELEAVGEESHALMARRTLSWACDELGDPARALELRKENLARARAQGNRRMEARSLGAFVEAAFEEGRLDEARRLKNEVLRIDLELGNIVFVAVGMRDVALFNAEREATAAARLLARADVLMTEVGFAEESWMFEERERALTAVKSELDEATFTQAWDEGLRMTQDEAVALALLGDP